MIFHTLQRVEISEMSRDEINNILTSNGMTQDVESEEIRNELHNAKLEF